MAKKESSSKSVTFDAIDQQIREKRFAPVYLLHGEEPFFIDRLCKMFEEGILEPEERDFNQVVLYGKDTTADMVLANAKQFPFGSPYRVVILKEAKELKNIELLSTYAENPSPQTIFIVCYKYGKMKAAQVKPYSKHGVVFESEGVKDWKLNEWIQNLAEKTFHFRLNPQTAAVLGEHIGNDLSRIYTEFQKLQVVLPPNSEITPDVVEKYIGIWYQQGVQHFRASRGPRQPESDESLQYHAQLHAAS